MTTALDLIGKDTELQNHWIRRLIAIIIDVIIIYIVFWIITIAFIFTVRHWWLLFPLFAGIIWLFYTAILEGIRGATIGKSLINLQVIGTHEQMDIAKGFIRNISKIHGLILLLDFLIGFVSHGDPRQRFLDRISNTTVIRTDVQERFPGAAQGPPRHERRGVGIPLDRHK